MIKRIASLGLFVSLVASSPTPPPQPPPPQSPSLTPAAVPSEPFIALGDAGQSQTFASLATLYIHRSDPQPRCPGCYRLRLLLDDRAKTSEGSPSTPAAAPFAHSAALNLTASCQGMPAPFRAPLSSIWRYPWSPREVQLTLSFDPTRCTGTSATLELYADECSTPSRACRKQVVRHRFDIPLTAISALKPWLEDAYPNRLNNAEDIKR